VICISDVCFYRPQDVNKVWQWFRMWAYSSKMVNSNPGRNDS